MTKSSWHLDNRIREEVERLLSHGEVVTLRLLAAALGMSLSAVRRHAKRLVADRLLQLGDPGPMGQITLTLGEADASASTLHPGTADAGQAKGGAGGPSPAPAGPLRGPTPPGSEDASAEPRRQRRGSNAFNPSNLDHMMISLPLQELMAAMDTPGGSDARFLTHGRRISLIVDLNLGYPGGLAMARQRLFDLLVRVGYDLPEDMAPPAVHKIDKAPLLDRLAPSRLRGLSGQYVFAWLTPEQIKRLVELEFERRVSARAVYRLWPDNFVETQNYGALPTIKADAAARAFGCDGSGIVWAVVDSGIDGFHPHFEAAANLRDLPPGVAHADFSEPDTPAPLIDEFGHGSHVAGIIAGTLDSEDVQGGISAVFVERDQNQRERTDRRPLAKMAGVAPRCKLVSYKVLDARGKGPVTRVIAALEDIYRCNGDGRHIRIHGVNLSVGYPFEARWYACGHSPLCDVIDRLVRSGVVVVAAAGNNGYALTDIGQASWGQGKPMSITDPGNAERAITVGATHRVAPHTYGVSYFSSKGPTGDGRQKPDLLAPGEKILSVASGRLPGGQHGQAVYKEDSGTSMAAPHVSGAIAAFLSVRSEFIGRAEDVKAVFLESAIDLKRNRNMQGHGLLDLMRALQSV